MGKKGNKRKKNFSYHMWTPGTVVVFDQEGFNQEWWKSQTEEDLLKWYGSLGYGQEKKKLFIYLCETLDNNGDPFGHCTLVDMDTQMLIAMRHTSDFRRAKQEEL